MWSSNKVFKDIKIFWIAPSRPFIRYQGKNLDWFWIWCCFLFLLHIASRNLIKTFTFFCMSFLSYESHSELFEQSNFTFYASTILPFKVFINASKLTGEMAIDWSFFLGVWHSVNSLSASLTDWNLSWSSIHLVCL